MIGDMQGHDNGERHHVDNIEWGKEAVYYILLALLLKLAVREISVVYEMLTGLNKDIWDCLLNNGMGMVPLVPWMLGNGILDIMYLRWKSNIQLEKVLL